MKNCPVLFLISLLIISSCNSTTPLDSQFWTSPQTNRAQISIEKPEEEYPTAPSAPVTSAESNNHTYIVNLYTLSPAHLGEIAGRATIEINETDVTTSLGLVEVPQMLMIGQRSLTRQSCSEIAAAFPSPEVVTINTEFKTVNDVELASREALTRELNQMDIHNGDEIDLEGVTYVVKAYVETFNTPEPSRGELIPIACGTILAQ